MPRRQSNPPPIIARKWVLLLIVLVIWIGGGIGWIAFKNARSASPGDSENNAKSFHLSDQAKTYAAYGGSASCRECHKEEYAAWAGSHHALAERAPSEAMDEAAFTPARTFHHGTQQTSLRAANGRYEVITMGLHGTNEVFPVQRVIAENPLRQMLLAFPGGRLQATEAAWDPRSNQWFNVYGNEDRKPGEWGHWTGRGMNWNSMCAACHNTRLRKNYDAATDTFHTAMVETGVGCEACHGPMKAHNDWQHAHKGGALKDPTVHKLTRDEMFDTCASCHSRRAELTGDFKPGDHFFDHHQLSIVDDSTLFYPDGQVHDEDYEVTAFLGSRMFHKGVRCVDCHDAHTMKTRLPGNLLCLSCHASGTMNAPIIDPVSHSHHQVFGYNAQGVLTNLNITAYKPSQVKETGGECINCHMPQTVYMQRHWRHDHGFTIPDPLLTKKFAIPNACNRCHQDKDADWSLKYVEQWYGEKMNRPYRQHAEIVAQARQGDDGAEEPLLKMLETDEIPYWQAMAAGLLQRWVTDPKVSAALLQQLQQTNPLVRQMAVQSLGPLAQAGQADIASALTPKLQDPSRNVRIETARVLSATLDTNSLAGSEYLHFLDHISDQPLGQLQMGVFKLARGNPTNALPYFQKAVEWDPFSPGIHDELATVFSQLGRTQAAVKELEQAVQLTPTNADFHFQLALALNDAGESGRVVSELEQAVKYDSNHARAWYNLGLARSAQGNDSGALAALLRAEALEPSAPRIPYARATVLVRMGRINEAKTAARRVLELDPHSTQAAALLQRLDER